MRKVQKKQVEEFVLLLEEAHQEIKSAIRKKNIDLAKNLLEQCWNGANKASIMIAALEGEDFVTVSLLQEYSEMVNQVYIALEQVPIIKGKDAEQMLKNSWNEVYASVKKDIPVRKEVVFCPYKASMWDSLESVWMAADEDSNCDVYVVPIPYFDKLPDGNFGEMHYEGGQYPEYVPVIDYREYDFVKRKPDVIYIHNPYDDGNYITSIHPQFYSKKLKEYTDCLVYIPYYVTSGGMSEVQYWCVAYDNVDYIVIQAESLRKYFDSKLPNEKFLSLGSPKLDRIIKMCQNPPDSPSSWKKKMEGKKVYFYNTSIGGMLGNTEAFLKKMKYVFECFEGREDACLLWRPHPLLESTFVSMRRSLVEEYKDLKQYFIEEDIGIYDDTSDIEKTIAQCDVYIGDSATSVTSLFGIVGKPLFILNNNIHTAPEIDDWRAEIVNGFSRQGYDEWKIIQGNKLYYAPKCDYKYEFYCNLSEYANGGDYSRVFDINGKIYVCPANAQDILIVANKKIEKKIELNKYIECAGAFVSCWNIGQYIFLIPNKYPVLVRYDIKNDKVEYSQVNKDIFLISLSDGDRIGGGCVWGSYLLCASPIDNRVLSIESKTMKTKILCTGAKHTGGTMIMQSNGNDVWLLPFVGKTITRWNPMTGEVQEYTNIPEDYRCIKRPNDTICEERPFGAIAFGENKIIIPPYWGDRFLSLDIKTGEFSEWKLPFDISFKEKNEYYLSFAVGSFVRRTDTLGEYTYLFFSYYDRKAYHVNIETREYEEIPIIFNYEELRNHEFGFAEISQWLPYGCNENVFNSLSDLLNGTIAGNKFEKQKQIQSYTKVSVNYDGTCGEKVHQYIMSRV